MRRGRRLRRTLAGMVAALSLSTMLHASAAADGDRKFLDALRERGYCDVAVDYLEQLRADPRTKQELKDAIDYEAGLLLIEAARTGQAAAVRQQALADAKQRLERFLGEHPQHPLAGSARRQLVGLLAERGRIEIEQAGRASRPGDQRARLVEKARSLYQAAQQGFASLEAALAEKCRQFPKFIDPRDTLQIATREQARRDLVEVQMSAAGVLYEIAQTYPRDSAQARETLGAAARRYHELHEKYGVVLAGCYARLYEGRCCLELGEVDKAMAAFAALLAQRDEPEEFRRMKRKATVLALEAALWPKVARYQDALAICHQWEQTGGEIRGGLSQFSSDENGTVPFPRALSADGLAIQYLGGEAAWNFARTLSADDAEQAKLRQEVLGLARRRFESAAGAPGDFQQKARIRLRAREFAEGDRRQPEPASFAEARDRAELALGAMTAAEEQLRREQQQGNEQDVKRCRQEIVEAREEALKYFRAALALEHDGATADAIDSVRCRLAYLCWLCDDWQGAAALGDFLARRSADDERAWQSAKIALAACTKLFNLAPPRGRKNETDRMRAVAEYVVERWPGQPEAEQAWMMLIRAAVENRKPQQAIDCLARISLDSARRDQSELMTAQSLWSAYLGAAQGPEDQRPSQAESEETAVLAQRTLEDGILRMRRGVDGGGEPSDALANAVLALAQITVETAQADIAVVWLEDPKIGVMTLAAAGLPSTGRESYAVEAYKAALRAYAATQQFDKAESAMQSLEKVVNSAGEVEAAQRLARIYTGLGRELRDQFQRLRKEEKPGQLRSVSQRLDRFLATVSQREGQRRFNSLSWVAEGYLALGSGFDPGGAKLPEEARHYYGRAADTYRTILRRCAEAEFGAPAGAEASFKIRLARCLRRQGQHQEALDMLLEVLGRHARMVDAQIEAAYTCQAWGEQQPSYLQVAILGSTLHKEIWGWAQLANHVVRSVPHRDIFHEARYNLALCRFKLAQSSATAEERSGVLKQAENDILIIHKLYPDMGGKVWYDKYDDLLKTIQRLRDQKPLGLHL